VGQTRQCFGPGHTCSGSTYTYTPLFLRKVNGGIHTVALCINNVPCASTLCRPSLVYSLPLFAGSTSQHGPTGYEMTCGVPCLQKKRCNRSMNSGPEKDT
jgi:hypothetical protein